MDLKSLAPLCHCATMRQQVGGTYIKFCFWFTQSGKVCTIHKEDNAIDGREVVFPHSAGCVNQHTNQRQTWESAGSVYRIFIMRCRYVSWRITANVWIILFSDQSGIGASLAKNISIRSIHDIPCAWPPRSKVVKVMPAIVSSSEAGGRN